MYAFALLMTSNSAYSKLYAYKKKIVNGHWQESFYFLPPICSDTILIQKFLINSRLSEIKNIFPRHQYTYIMQFIVEKKSSGNRFVLHLYSKISTRFIGNKRIDFSDLFFVCFCFVCFASIFQLVFHCCLKLLYFYLFVGFFPATVRAVRHAFITICFHYHKFRRIFIVCRAIWYDADVFVRYTQTHGVHNI